MPEPIMPPRSDGMYYYCVRCRGALGVAGAAPYSEGKVPCVARDGCGQFIPRAYIKRQPQW